MCESVCLRVAHVGFAPVRLIFVHLIPLLIEEYVFKQQPQPQVRRENEGKIKEKEQKEKDEVSGREKVKSGGSRRMGLETFWPGMSERNQ